MLHKLKSTNRKRLASLSALGAGALGVTAGPAQASIIYSGPVDAHIGFDDARRFTLAGPNGAGGVFRTEYVSCGFTCSFAFSWIALHSKQGPNGTQFQFQADPLAAVILAAPANALWSTGGGQAHWVRERGDRWP